MTKNSFMRLRAVGSPDSTSTTSSTGSHSSSESSRFQNATLPLTRKRRTNERRKPKFDITVPLKVAIKLILALILLAIVSFIGFVFAMHVHNSKSIRDPCAVAEMSKHELQVKQSRTTSEIPGVPKIIHQQWKDENIPEKFMKWRNKWLEFYPQPEYEYMLWTDENGRQLIEQQYPWFLATYDSYQHNINRADALRYFVLHHYGGIYADLDYEATTNFFEYLPQDQVGMVESPYYWNEKTQNCLMSSPKDDPFWDDLFVVLVKNSVKEKVLEATGPILLDQAMEFSSHSTYVLPCENFQRVPLGEYDQTLWTTVYDREIMFRLKPISKHCGYYSNNQCHFGKHHNTVSYRNTSGQIIDA
mmetsp:Transcript_13805/g.16765  ORF Transcript_13805/g.16765 Transcript_13805/m.16765 type:complete len:359 (+) Transcript_13805:86-1162(+)